MASTMAGETDLEVLLQSMSPVLDDGEYVFCSLPEGASYDHLEPVAFIREKEGISLIIPENTASKNNIPSETVFKCITLTVHSSLDAVGLTAAVSSKLAAAGISANIVAGYYHDHIFVQASQADKALQALKEFGTPDGGKTAGH